MTKVRLQIIGIVLAVSGTIAFMVYSANAAKESAQIKLRTQVTSDTYAAITFYLEQHDGQWPTSWKTLATVNDHDQWERPHIKPGFFEQWVQVDFAYDPQELAQTAFSDFKAISPKGEVLQAIIKIRHTELIRANEKYRDAASPPDLNDVDQSP